jgi:hypothetical protein
MGYQISDYSSHVDMPEDYTQCISVLIAMCRVNMALMDEVAALRGNQRGLWTIQLEENLREVLRSSVSESLPKSLEIARGLVRLSTRRIDRRFKPSSADRHGKSKHRAAHALEDHSKTDLNPFDLDCVPL